MVKVFSALLFVYGLILTSEAGSVLPRVLMRINPDVQPVEELSRRDPVELANEFMQQKLIPAIEKDSITQSDVEGLAFCLHVMFAQASRYCAFVEHYMGIDRITEPWPEIKVANSDFKECLNELRQELSNDSIKIDITGAAQLRSFCKKYNKNEGTQLFMAGKLDQICRESQQEEDENPDSYSDINMDVSKYGNFPKLGWWARYGWWLGHWGWGVGLYSRRKYFVETVPTTNDKVEEYLGKRHLIPAGVNDVITKRSGPYRKPYEDLARAARLVKKCREREWKGLDYTDQDKKDLDNSAEKAESVARNMLKYMERAYVDYPLLFELTEAATICLYLHYLDEHDKGSIWKGRVDYTDKTAGIRKGFLDNAENIGDICSRFLNHSSLNTASHCADVYNRVFPWVYATNRNDFARGGSDDAQIVFRKKYDPLLHDNEIARVKSGEIEIHQRDFRREMQRVVDKLAKDETLRQVLSVRIGEQEFKCWLSKAQSFLPDAILYPLWCDEMTNFLEKDPITHKVKKEHDGWIRGPAQKIKAKIKAILDMVNKNEEADRNFWERVMAKMGWGVSDIVKGLRTFSECIQSANDMDDMKKSLLYDMKHNRKASENLKGRLKNAEETVDGWVNELSANMDLKELQDYMASKVLPLWNDCQKVKRKIDW